MLGRKSGVAKQLCDLYPKIITWHCLNHRLELAVGDTVSDVSGVNHFQVFMDKLCTVYSRSQLNQWELAECAAELHQQVGKLGHVLNTRWVASSYRTVSAAWNNLESLCAHFHYATMDEKWSANDKKLYGGLLKRLTSNQLLFGFGAYVRRAEQVGSVIWMFEAHTISCLHQQADPPLHLFHQWTRGATWDTGPCSQTGNITRQTGHSCSHWQLKDCHHQLSTISPESKQQPKQ